MKSEKSASGLPFLATVVLLIVVILLLFVSYTYIYSGIGDSDGQSTDVQEHVKKLDIVFFKELEILLGAIVFIVTAGFILILLRHKRII